MRRIFTITPKRVPKGWGEEVHIANYLPEIYGDLIKEKGYCLKLLKFKGKSEGSMHYHATKHEVFYCAEGEFEIRYIHTDEACRGKIRIRVGDSVEINQNNPHQIVCLSESGGLLIEASSPDRPEDSYRIEKGDSQRG